MDIRKEVEQLIAIGYDVVPLAPKTRDCYAPNWPKIKFSISDFNEKDNVGIKTINGIVDVDLDSPETVELADYFLPKTQAVYGRRSKPGSHRLYKCKEHPDKTRAYLDFSSTTDIGKTLGAKTCLVEIRLNNQSMAPPSIHPDNEVVTWQPNLTRKPTEVNYADLRRAVQLLTTTAILIRYYVVEGQRHNWLMLLSATFRRLGIEEEEAVKIVKIAAKKVNDSEPSDRIQAVQSTYNRGDDESLSSDKQLAESMEIGQSFLKTLRKIWSYAGVDHRGFILDNKDKLNPNSQDNVMKAIEKLGHKLSYDEFARKILLDGIEIDDLRSNRIYLEIDKRFNFRPTLQFFRLVLTDVAYKNKFHPVKDYLNSLKWDGKKRLDTWLQDFAGAEQNRYVSEVGKLPLIAAVRRIFRPGTKFDEMLILESDQGKNKSTALRTLCQRNESWFKDDLHIGANSKDTIEGTAGVWIVEAAELGGMKKYDVERLRSFLSRTKDGPVRLAYAHFSTQISRQFVIIGTINPGKYLKDFSGNRRFWPVKVNEFDIGRLSENVDQLWAEAVELEKTCSIRMNSELYGDAHEEQELRRVDDPWEIDLGKKLSRDKNYRFTDIGPLFDLVGLAVKDRQLFHTERMTKVLDKLGFSRMTMRNKEKDKLIWGYGRDSLQVQEIKENIKRERKKLKGKARKFKLKSDQIVWNYSGNEEEEPPF